MKMTGNELNCKTKTMSHETNTDNPDLLSIHYFK